MASTHTRMADGYLTANIISGVMLAIGAACVALRFIVRIRSNLIWWDDWLILAAFITGFGTFLSGVLCALPSLGAAGYHIGTYTIPELNTWAKLGLASEVLYTFSVAFSKASILLFYRRIFSIDRQFLIFMRIMMFLIVAACLTYAFGCIFSTNPVEAQWTVTMSYTMIDVIPFYTIVGSINMLLDVAVIAIVQRKIWNLNLDRNRKLGISALLLLAAFSIVAGILRVIYVGTMDLTDLTYSLTTGWIWASVEFNLYIICACLPVIWHMFKRQKPPTSMVQEGSGRKLALVTFGSSQPYSKQSTAADSDGVMIQSDYQVLHEVRGDLESHGAVASEPPHANQAYI